jgi:multidrug efflux system outer membrane protein
MMTTKLTLRISAAVLLAAGVLSGCSLAPVYQRPAAPVAGEFPLNMPRHRRCRAAPVDTGWREFFADERLQRLIATALENNRDLRTAALRIEEARAAYNIQRADRAAQPERGPVRHARPHAGLCHAIRAGGSANDTMRAVDVGL